MMTTHEDHDPLLDYDDHSSTSKKMEDRPVGDDETTRCETKGVYGDDNAKLRVNDAVNETERTVADADITVSHGVDIFMTALVDRAYTRSESTTLTKENADE